MSESTESQSTQGCGCLLLCLAGIVASAVIFDIRGNVVRILAFLPLIVGWFYAVIHICSTPLAIQPANTASNDPSAQRTFNAKLFIWILFTACIASYQVFAMPGDAGALRQIWQVAWFLLFIAASKWLLFSVDCGGPAGLEAIYFCVGVVSVLVYILDGFWWFHRSEQVGSPILFANALYSLILTYPFIHLAFLIESASVKQRRPVTGSMLAFLALTPFLAYCWWTAERYSDAEKAVWAIRYARYFGATATEYANRESTNHYPSASSTETIERGSSSRSGPSYLTSLRGKDWHNFTPSERRDVCERLAIPLQKKYPFVTANWLLLQLNEFYRNGNAPNEPVVEIVAILAVAAANER